MKKYKIFEFTKYEYDEEKSTLSLYYLVDNDFEFVEEINFNPKNLSLRKLNELEKSALDLSFKYLHLVAGISYYKAFLPDEIKINTVTLNKEQAEFFNSLYLNGLGEFSFKNQVKLNINFKFDDSANNNAINIKLNNDFIVPIGGGKDSVVTLELLKKVKDIKLTTFSVNSVKTIEDCCSLAECENILVTRKISSNLLEVNKDLEKYNAYNGHVPITAIIAFISLSVGILYNKNTTVISNEKSANVGNIEYDGRLVNHQWSKSFEAEKMINSFMKKYITNSFTYFSLLRAVYEIRIAKMFSEINKYDLVFSSCNKNFKVIKDKRIEGWCCDCDKCRFVFLILACFISKDRMLKIFGKNILDDESQLEGFRELVGLCSHKPFECVGEIEESQLAFYLIQNTDFKNDFISKNIFNELDKSISKGIFEKLKNQYLSIDFTETNIDDSLKKLL